MNSRGCTSFGCLYLPQHAAITKSTNVKLTKEGNEMQLHTELEKNFV